MRSYGLYAHACRDELEQARREIVPSAEWLDARKRLERAAEKRRADHLRCPICGLLLVVVTDSEERSGAPPQEGHSAPPSLHLSPSRASTTW